MPRFIAFDVESPNHLSDRMSAIFDYFNTRITGISEETVWDAPTFPELWPEIEPLMSGGLFITWQMNSLSASRTSLQ
jgi:DNA polymerase-3 subunit epsilon